MTEQAEEPRRLDINWVQAAGGALAAVSSAVLLSTVGVAGTIVGAAAGSVIVTVGNAVYTHYLAASKERVAAAALVAKQKAARARNRTRPGATATAEMRMPASDRDDAADDAADDVTDDVADDVADDAAVDVAEAEEEATQPTNWGEIFSTLNWKRIAVAAAGIFVLAMGAILTFELVAGHSVSSYTGGSSKDGPRTSFGGSADPKETEPTKPGSTEPTRSTPTDATTTTTAPESQPEDATTTTTAPPEETEAPTTTTQPPTTTPKPTRATADAEAEAEAEPGAAQPTQ